MRVGLVCYPSVGGSGIVATELARSLAARGHAVHVVSTEAPFRLPDYQAGIAFHRVRAPGYPVLREPQFLLATANRLVQVAREHTLDVLHAHYAIPHAVAGYLARETLRASAGSGRVPALITTLHGTDITLLGSDRSYLETTRFVLDQSDAVTAVSRSLRNDTVRLIGVTREIDVIPNFLDVDEYRRTPQPQLRAYFCPPDRFDALVVHVSNFRAVKRVDAVVDVFARIRRRVNARLVLVGDGPESDRVQERIDALDLRAFVEVLGEQQNLVGLLSVADLFLLPSSQESFGLAALEAMGCEVPVVASRVGGLPEVITDDVTGALHAPDDVEGMAASAIRLLTDRAWHDRVALAARASVVERFSETMIVPQYEALYERLIA